MKNTVKNVPAPEKAALTPLGALKYIICYSSVLFTAISVVVLIAQALSASESGITFADPARFLAIYPFALFAAAASLVFKAKMNTFWKILIHYGVSVVAFYLFICAPIKEYINSVAIVALVSILYFICAAIEVSIRASIERKKRDSVPYQSVYGKITRK